MAKNSKNNKNSEFGGRDNFKIVRSLLKTELIGDLVVIVFTMLDDASFEKAINKWYPLVYSASKDIPIYFLCSKIDLVPSFVHASTEQVQRRKSRKKEISEKIKLLGSKYYECSALTQDGLIPAMERIIQFVKKVENFVNFFGGFWCVFWVF